MWITLAFVVALPGCGGAMSDLDQQDVRQVLQRQKAAWNHGDLDRFMAAYENSPRLVFTAGGDIERGYKEAVARYRRRYGQSRGSMGQLDFQVLDVRGIGRDAAVVLGKWQLLRDGKGVGGVFSLVLERKGSAWKIVHDHTSTGRNWTFPNTRRQNPSRRKAKPTPTRPR